MAEGEGRLGAGGVPRMAIRSAESPLPVQYRFRGSEFRILSKNLPGYSRKASPTSAILGQRLIQAWIRRKLYPMSAARNAREGMSHCHIAGAIKSAPPGDAINSESWPKGCRGI